MSRIVILHFHPLEQYPPVMNFIRYAESNSNDLSEILVISRNSYNKEYLFSSTSSRIKIKRFGRSDNKYLVFRYLGYFYYYLAALLFILNFNPHTILYYETISAFPALLFKWIRNAKCRLFVHYHEYTSPGEYLSGMKLVKYFHNMEQKKYSSFEWISHTNDDRLRMFSEDNKAFHLPSQHVLPNYPPAEWYRNPNIHIPDNESVKLVYVGALNDETMFVREICQWISISNNSVTLDLYSTNIEAKTLRYVESLNCKRINFHGGLNYYDLPAVLSKYDVGLILYKGHIPNYIFNAPNKLFEYLSVGLDVWYPEVMQGVNPYRCENTFPKVVPIDYNDLENLNVELISNRNGLLEKKQDFYCDLVFERMYNRLVCN